MSDRGSERSLSTAGYEYELDRNGQRVRVLPARTPLASGRHDEDAVPRTQGRQPAPVSAWGDRRSSTTSRGSGARGPPLIRHGQAQQPIPSSSPPENPNYSYTSRTGSRHDSLLPQRQIEYPAPGAPRGPVLTVPQAHPAEFRSRLSTLAREFVTINVGEYAACEKFIKQNPNIVDEDEADFMKEATAAMVAGKETYAMCCVQQLLLLRACSDLSSSKEKKDYFTSLIKKEKQAIRAFLTDRDKVMDRLRSKAQNISQYPTSQTPEITSSLEGLSLDGPTDRHGVGHPGGSLPIRNQQNITSSDPRARDALGSRRPTASNASDAPTFLGPGGQPEVLDNRYHLRKDGAAFFTFGRVFAILWHSSTGISIHDRKRGGEVRTGRFGEHIHSHIQRMAVVKEDHGFCWCIPINTYNGQGVAKVGFNIRDVLAHAIIYMKGSPSQGATGEPKMSKKPIEVTPAAPDQQLDSMSRIHFGKVHTVEHNVKVMNVGQVTKDSLQYFEGYWSDKAAEEIRHRQR